MKINKFTPDTKIFNEMDVNKKKESNSKDKFKEFFKEKLDGVNEKQVKAENISEDFIKGKEKNVHNVMLTTQEAKMSLDMAIQVRNKLVEAYQELNRMQI
ncbi:flagellar hook-basal body complex protein FliE [Haloimpatiens sp. FM7330]|uniref:flagellar hook-basal body complex protein FliE n=1 Tax=Haloimpatiens sp. FM7330 TaxID=3298610 RepID=UPI003639D68B